jgi:K+/H+ antiporter YhaU regulatory subunit KhtT
LGAAEKADAAWEKPVEDPKAAAQGRYVFPFKTGQPPLTAFAAYIQDQHGHIVGKTVGDLALCNKYSVIVLLVDSGEKGCVLCPGKNTVITAPSWVYFGVHKGKDDEDEIYDQAFTGIASALSGQVAASERIMDGPSDLLAFTLDFDCFAFPSTIGKSAVLGAKSDQASAPTGDAVFLDLRQRFNINLAGVLKNGENVPVWFPGPDMTVSPGDLGIVVRRPCRDGSTASTISDENIARLYSATIA